MKCKGKGAFFWQGVQKRCNWLVGHLPKHKRTVLLKEKDRNKLENVLLQRGRDQSLVVHFYSFSSNHGLIKTRKGSLEKVQKSKKVISFSRNSHSCSSGDDKAIQKRVQTLSTGHPSILEKTQFWGQRISLFRAVVVQFFSKIGMSAIRGIIASVPSSSSSFCVR